MPVAKFHWICSYDISNPRRLMKIHKLLCMLGIAINYSVFYLYLSTQQYKQLVLQLGKLIRPEDDFRLYRCTALHRAEVIGELSPTGIHLINSKGIML